MGFCINLILTLVGIAFGVVLSWLIQKYSEYHLLRKLVDTVKGRKHVSLSEEFLLTRILAGKIKSDDFKPEVIVAVEPGGAMVGEWLSRRFLGSYEEPIPLLNIWVDTDRKEGPGLAVEKANVRDGIQTIGKDITNSTTVLLVTDICRSGNTLDAAFNYLQKFVSQNNIRTVALLRHVKSRAKPSYITDITEKTIYFDWKSAFVVE